VQEIISGSGKNNQAQCENWVWARKIVFDLRAKEQRGKFCAGGVVRDVESEHGKQSARKGGAVRKPTHKAFDAENIHQHP